MGAGDATDILEVVAQPRAVVPDASCARPAGDPAVPALRLGRPLLGHGGCRGVVGRRRYPAPARRAADRPVLAELAQVVVAERRAVTVGAAFCRRQTARYYDGRIMYNGDV